MDNSSSSMPIVIRRRRIRIIADSDTDTDSNTTINVGATMAEPAVMPIPKTDMQCQTEVEKETEEAELLDKMYKKLDLMVERISKKESRFMNKIHKYKASYKRKYNTLLEYTDNLNVSICVALFIVVVVCGISGMITIGDLV